MILNLIKGLEIHILTHDTLKILVTTPLKSIKMVTIQYFRIFVLTSDEKLKQIAQ
jgi:hypothetical protein